MTKRTTWMPEKRALGLQNDGRQLKNEVSTRAKNGGLQNMAKQAISWNLKEGSQAPN